MSLDGENNGDGKGQREDGRRVIVTDENSVKIQKSGCAKLLKPVIFNYFFAPQLKVCSPE